MSEMSWVGCKVNVDCGEIGIFDGKVFEIDDNEGCMKLKNGGYIFETGDRFALEIISNAWQKCLYFLIKQKIKFING